MTEEKKNSKKKKKDHGLKDFLYENTNILKKELMNIFRRKNSHNTPYKKKDKSYTKSFVNVKSTIYENKNINKSGSKYVDNENIYKKEERKEDEEYVLFLRYIYNDLSSFIAHVKDYQLNNSDRYDVENIIAIICDDICKKTLTNIHKTSKHRRKKNITRENNTHKTETKKSKEAHDFIRTDSKKKEKTSIEVEKNVTEKNDTVTDSFFFIPPLEYILSYINKLNIEDMQQFIHNNDIEIESICRDSIRNEKSINAMSNEGIKVTNRKKGNTREENVLITPISSIHSDDDDDDANQDSNDGSSQQSLVEYEIEKDTNKTHKNDSDDRVTLFVSSNAQGSIIFNKISKKDSKQNLSDEDENKCNKIIHEKNYAKKFNHMNKGLSTQYENSSELIKSVISKSEQYDRYDYIDERVNDVEYGLKREGNKTESSIRNINYMTCNEEIENQFFETNNKQDYYSKFEKERNDYICQEKRNMWEKMKKNETKKIVKMVSNESKKKTETNDEMSNSSFYSHSNEYIEEKGNTTNEAYDTNASHQKLKNSKYIEELKENDKQNAKEGQITIKKNSQEKNTQQINIHTGCTDDTNNYNTKEKEKLKVELDLNEYKEKLQKLLNSKKKFKEETKNKNEFQRNNNLHDDYYYFKYLNESEDKINPYHFTKVETKKKIQVTPSAFPQFLRDIQICDTPTQKIRLKKTNITVKNGTDIKNKSDGRKRKKEDAKKVIDVKVKENENEQ